MKKKLNLLLLLSAFIFKGTAQVVLYEGFSSSFNPSANGWSIQNLSSPTGTNVNGWFPGDQSVLTSITGNPGDYYAADMNSTASAGTTNTISCWLITPTLNLVNGARLQFATKGSKLPVQKADRIQVYYSVGTGTNVGTTVGSATNTAGTFTNLIYEVNANTLATGYPTLWFAMSTVLSGITTPTVGRLAFRYYVPNAGQSGPNGNYIGLDEIRYVLPCSFPSFFGDQSSGGLPCVGSPVPLSITNTAPSTALTSYTWFTGANTSTTSFVPSVAGLKEIWSIAESTPGCQLMDISLLSVFPSPTLAVVATPSAGICSGGQVTLTASGANTYTYVLSPTYSITHNPAALAASTVTNVTINQFTVVGTGTNACVGRSFITLTVNPLPTVSVTSSASLTCINTTATLTASGAASYSWSGATSSTVNPLVFNSGTTPGLKQFNVYGISPAGCKSTNVVRTLSVSICNGLNDEGNSFSSEIMVFPNPFEDCLTLKNFNGWIEIYNELGQLLVKQELKSSEIIKTSAMLPGIYTLKTTTYSGEPKSFKLVKK